MLGRTRAVADRRYGDAEHGFLGGTTTASGRSCSTRAAAPAVGPRALRRRLRRVRYLGVDVSTAVDVAAARSPSAGCRARSCRPTSRDCRSRPGSVDVIFSEGVLHHTDSTREALCARSRGCSRPAAGSSSTSTGARGPIREFTRRPHPRQLQEMAPAEAWEALMPLTQLGKALGELDVEVDVPEDDRVARDPGRPDRRPAAVLLARRQGVLPPRLELSELNHINFDWYAPRNAHRQSVEEVRAWCAEAGLEIEREDVQEAGITVIARKPSRSQDVRDRWHARARRAPVSPAVLRRMTDADRPPRPRRRGHLRRGRRRPRQPPARDHRPVAGRASADGHARRGAS